MSINLSSIDLFGTLTFAWRRWERLQWAVRDGKNFWKDVKVSLRCQVWALGSGCSNFKIWMPGLRFITLRVRKSTKIIFLDFFFIYDLILIFVTARITNRNVTKSLAFIAKTSIHGPNTLHTKTTMLSARGIQQTKNPILWSSILRTRAGTLSSIVSCCAFSSWYILHSILCRHHRKSRHQYFHFGWQNLLAKYGWWLSARWSEHFQDETSSSSWSRPRLWILITCLLNTNCIQHH